MKYTLYFLAFDAVFTWQHFFKTPLKWIIKLFTGSKYNHVAYVYNYANQKNYIKQVVGTGYESIDYMDCFKKRYSKIYAYEITVSIDFELLHKNTLRKIGRPYATKKAPYSVIDRIPVVNWIYRKVFKVSQNDKDIFCSEDGVNTLQEQGYLGNIKDSNSINPEEFIKELLKNQLCNPKRFLIWNKNQLEYNIFINNS